MNKFVKLISHKKFKRAKVIVGIILVLIGIFSIVSEFYFYTIARPLQMFSAISLGLFLILLIIEDKYAIETKYGKQDDAPEPRSITDSYSYSSGYGYSTDFNYAKTVGDNVPTLHKEDDSVFIVYRGHKVVQVEYIDGYGIKIIDILYPEMYECLFPVTHQNKSTYILDKNDLTKNRFEVLNYKSVSLRNDLAVNDFLKSHCVFDEYSGLTYLHYSNETVAIVDDGIPGVYTVLTILNEELFNILKGIIDYPNISSGYSFDTATGKYYLTYKGIKIAEIDGVGQIVKVLVSELYDEYMKNSSKKYKLDEFNEEIRAEIAEKL